MSATIQIMIDFFGTRPAVAALVESRIWVDDTPPEAVAYDPSQGPAIVITGRGGAPAYVPGLKDPAVAVRVYGFDRAEIRAVCDEIDKIHATPAPYCHGVMDVYWQDQTDPALGWPFAFSLWTLHIRA
jgi:hypothetical protein